METIKDRAIVKGAKGVADFVFKHIKEIKGGCTVDFALDNPVTDIEPIEDFKKKCTSWCGIARAEVPRVLDADIKVLCVCSYGGSCSYPVFIPLGIIDGGSPFIAAKVNEFTEYEEGNAFKDDELVYVELVER